MVFWLILNDLEERCQLMSTRESHQKVVIYLPGQIITTSAEVTLNGGLVRESPQNPLNSGLGIIQICSDLCFATAMISMIFGNYRKG